MANFFNDSLVEEQRQPFFQRSPNGLISMDQIQNQKILRGKGGEVFGSHFLKEPEKSHILDFSIDNQLNVVIVGLGIIRLLLSLFDGIFDHPINALT